MQLQLAANIAVKISVNIDVQANSQGENLYEVNLSVNADAKTGDWFVGISSVKTSLPKPS